MRIYIPNTRHLPIRVRGGFGQSRKITPWHWTVQATHPSQHPQEASKSTHLAMQPHIKQGISGLVGEYIVAIDVTRVRFPADAFSEMCVFH